MRFDVIDVVRLRYIIHLVYPTGPVENVRVIVRDGLVIRYY